MLVNSKDADTMAFVDKFGFSEPGKWRTWLESQKASHTKWQEALARTGGGKFVMDEGIKELLTRCFGKQSELKAASVGVHVGV